jgi:hypothetical protein
MSESMTPVRLDDLIADINRTYEAPLDRVGGALELSEQLGEIADSLIGHFVDQARRAGASWTEIGRSMGVTKQAAQKRFVTRRATQSEPLDPSQGFSRFGPDARTVIVRAQEIARGRSNDQITVAHLTLALTEDTDGPAVRAITAQGVAIEDVARVAEATLPGAAAVVPALIPFDAHSRTALEQTFEVAQRRHAEMIGNEHLLLALLHVDDGTGILAGLGITAAAVEAVLDAGDGASAENI